MHVNPLFNYVQYLWSNRIIKCLRNNFFDYCKINDVKDSVFSKN